jgi:hypothetical protein
MVVAELGRGFGINDGSAPTRCEERNGATGNLQY